MNRPVIDVVIAVHSDQRPLARAVASCATGLGPGAVRVTVVCHDIDASRIQAASGLVASDALRFLEWRDAVRSPAGPKNRGLDAVDAEFTVMLDSDDYLEPGALDHWYTILTTRPADVVIAPVRHQSGALVLTPWARPGRRHDLDPVKDGLAYATAPRGMWRTSTAHDVGFRYTEGLRTGEDVEAGLRLYFSGARVEFPAAGPKYVLCDDADDRTTGDTQPLRQEFAAVERLDVAWLRSLPAPARASIATKLARLGLVGAMVRRGPDGDWTVEDLAAIAWFAHWLSDLSSGYRRALSNADRRLVDAAVTATTDRERVVSALTARRSVRPWDWYWNGELTGNLAREGALRQRVRAALDRR